MIYGSNPNLSCTIANDEAFVFLYLGELWQYYPSNDRWIKKKNFPGHRREMSNLIQKNNKI
jgi:hypothetical protein